MDPTNSPQNKAIITPTNSTNNTDQTSLKPSSSSSTTTTTKDLAPLQNIRSYTCTFCEKGFSNAQALGGHMNIHRRDRARLRNMDDSELGTKHANYTMISWDRNRDHDDHHDPDVRLLRLFDVSPKEDEVDLELRLGSPSSSSAAPKGSN